MPDTDTMPDVVYHYTSMSNMLNIVKTRQIWSTSIDYLNDISEHNYFLRCVRARLDAYLAAHPNIDPALFKRFLNRNTKEESFETRPFVASFCKKDDSLHHWRSYCPDGNGVSLGFRRSCLKRASVEDPASTTSGNVLSLMVSCRPVEYISKKDKKSADAAIRLVVEATQMPGMYAGLTRALKPSPADVFDILMDRLACFHKHESFASEEEYRLLVSQPLKNARVLLFHPKQSTLRPHIPITIPARAEGHEGDTFRTGCHTEKANRWDYIDRVVIGPTVNKVLSQRAVSAFFRQQKMCVEVESSRVPYRDW